MSIIHLHKKGWESVPRAVPEDLRLCDRSHRVLFWLLTRPENWEIRISAMLRLVNISQHVWQKIVSPELIKLGYMDRIKGKEEGRITWDYVIYSIPKIQFDPAAFFEADKKRPRRKPPVQKS